MSLQETFNSMGESDGEVSSIPKADYDIIESQIESPHLVSNPIIDSPPVKKDSFATVVNQQFCRIISEKENQPIEEVNSFVRLLNSDSDNVKFEAASSLLHVIKMNHTSVSKSHLYFVIDKWEYLYSIRLFLSSYII